jgi:hypothetical protein
VTGTPESGKKGVHRVGDDGGSELLLSGDPVGLALTDGELIFATDSCLEPSGGYYTYCAFRAGLDRVRELGPSFQPFTAAVLNQIGERMLPRPGSASTEGFPSDRDALSAFLAEAGEIALELTGAELPRSGAGVDALLSDLVYDRDLTEPAIVLLSAMLADALLEAGAVWVPTDAPEPPVWNRVGWEAENPFAVGLHPVTTVVNTLYLEESWYQPSEQIAEGAEGRTIVLGLDPASVGDRVRAHELTELDELIREARVPRLAEVLDRQPENTRLRTAVYGHLAGHGHHGAIVELAARYADGDDPLAVDLRAWLAGRLAGELSPEQVAEVIADLRGAIERAPDDAGLYLLLGSAYERSEEPERVALAGASYRKARDTVGWGPVHQAAQDLLEELDDEE